MFLAFKVNLIRIQILKSFFDIGLFRFDDSCCRPSKWTVVMFYSVELVVIFVVLYD
jgi:hypothetical protein